MKQRLLFSVLVMILLLGCNVPPRPSSSIEQFQTFDTQTIWTFAKQAGFPEELTGWKTGWTIDRLMNGSQVHLISQRGVLIYYEEYLPASMIPYKPSEFSSRFHGFGHLKKIQGIDKPIFVIDYNGSYASGNHFYADNYFIVGFVGKRKFEIIANKRYTTDKSNMRYPISDTQVSFDDAISLAVDVYERLSKRQ